MAFRKASAARGRCQWQTSSRNAWAMRSCSDPPTQIPPPTAWKFEPGDVSRARKRVGTKIASSHGVENAHTRANRTPVRGNQVFVWQARGEEALEELSAEAPSETRAH